MCRALRERGHKAILVDMFLGLEDYEGALEDIFDAPDGLCGQSRVERVEPDRQYHDLHKRTLTFRRHSEKRPCAPMI